MLYMLYSNINDLYAIQTFKLFISYYFKLKYVTQYRIAEMRHTMKQVFAI